MEQTTEVTTTVLESSNPRAVVLIKYVYCLRRYCSGSPAFRGFLATEAKVSFLVFRIWQLGICRGARKPSSGLMYAEKHILFPFLFVICLLWFTKAPVLYLRSSYRSPVFPSVLCLSQRLRVCCSTCFLPYSTCSFLVFTVVLDCFKPPAFPVPLIWWPSQQSGQ